MNNTFNNKKVPNVPNLRFPEFTDEWVVFKCSDVLDFYSTNSLAWEQLNFSNGKYKNIHYGLIHKGLSTHVYAYKALLPYVNEKIQLKNYSICNNGDIVFADASEDTLDVGKAVELIDCEKDNVICGLHTLHGRDNHNYTVLGYKGYAFASTSFHHQVRRLAQGTKVFSISAKNFNELYIGIPTKPEQTKIATLLSLIDQRIETQNKIIDKLESLIKGISNTVLNQTEGVKLAVRDFLKEQVEKSIVTNQYEILSSTINGIFKQSEYFDRNIASADNTGYKIIRCGDIVLSPQNLWMGNINYNNTFEIGVVSPSYKVFSIKNGFNAIFISKIMRTKRAFHNYLCVSEQGASVVRRNLNIEDFKEIVFSLPTLAIQNRIGAFLSELDKKLDIEVQLKAALFQQKKFFLQRLFI